MTFISPKYKSGQFNCIGGLVGLINDSSVHSVIRMYYYCYILLLTKDIAWSILGAEA